MICWNTCEADRTSWLKPRRTLKSNSKSVWTSEVLFWFHILIRLLEERLSRAQEVKATLPSFEFRAKFEVSVCQCQVTDVTSISLVIYSYGAVKCSRNLAGGHLCSFRMRYNPYLPINDYPKPSRRCQNPGRHRALVRGLQDHIAPILVFVAFSGLPNFLVP